MSVSTNYIIYKFSRIGQENLNQEKWKNLIEENEDPCDKRLVESLCCNSLNDISYLKSFNIVKELFDGSSIIDSTQRMRFKLPGMQNDTVLRTDEGKIWLNM